MLAEPLIGHSGGGFMKHTLDRLLSRWGQILLVWRSACIHRGQAWRSVRNF